jgi:multicomponent Na+:H+ antiporter subunit F
VWLLAVFLMLNIAAGIARVLRGPTDEDRVIAAILFGTTGVAVLLVLADLLQSPAVRDVALVLAVLAAVLAVVFTSSPPEARKEEREGERPGAGGPGVERSGDPATERGGEG